MIETEGTFYACSCWHQGPQAAHPPFCATHGKPQQEHFVPKGQVKPVICIKCGSSRLQTDELMTSPPRLKHHCRSCGQWWTVLKK